jgi:hypothetical protein
MDEGSSSGIKPDGRSTGEDDHKRERYDSPYLSF